MLFFPLTDRPTLISSRFVDRFTILFSPTNGFLLLFTPLGNDRPDRKFTFLCYVPSVPLDQNFLRCRFQFVATAPTAFKKILSSEQLDIFRWLLKMHLRYDLLDLR